MLGVLCELCEMRPTKYSLEPSILLFWLVCGPEGNFFLDSVFKKAGLLMDLSDIATHASQI